MYELPVLDEESRKMVEAEGEIISAIQSFLGCDMSVAVAIYDKIGSGLKLEEKKDKYYFCPKCGFYEIIKKEER